MKLDQDVTYVRGADKKLVFTDIPLDAGQVLDGTEDWQWSLRLTPEAASPVLNKTFTAPASPAGITVDPVTFLPTVVIAAADLTGEAASIDPVHYVHELRMTKSTKKDPVARGKFTLLTDIAQ